MKVTKYNKNNIPNYLRKIINLELKIKNDINNNKWDLTNY